MKGKLKPCVKKSFVLLFLIFIASIAFIAFLSKQAFSRYYSMTSNDTDLKLAPWKIVINDKEITKSGEVIVPTNFVIDEANSTSACTNTKKTGNKLVPGCVGYFDIQVDPTGTGVDVEYEIDFHPSSLSGGMIFTNYSTDNGVTKSNFPENYKITGTMNIVDEKLLDSNNILNYRVYFNYQDNDELNTTYPSPDSQYGVMVTVKLQQVI